jgi:hypothetical protein
MPSTMSQWLPDAVSMAAGCQALLFYLPPWAPQTLVTTNALQDGSVALFNLSCAGGRILPLRTPLLSILAIETMALHCALHSANSLLVSDKAGDGSARFAVVPPRR